MTNWYYAENGERRGPISEQELDALIAQGTIKPETLVWQTGMTEWKPLREINRVPELPEEKSEPEFPDANETQPVSPLASAPLTANLPDKQRPGPAWEQRAQIGFFKAIWQTIAATLMNPSATFAAMKRSGGLLNPWLFHFIVANVGGIISGGYAMMNAQNTRPLKHVAEVPALNQFVDNYNAQLAMMHHFRGTFAALYLLIILIAAAIAPFITAGILHLLLMLWSGAKQSFETTFRVVCYAGGAAAILLILPFCGGLISVVCGIVITIIGLAKAHDTTTGKATGAVLTPLLLICCCLGVAIAFGITAQGGH